MNLFQQSFEIWQSGGVLMLPLAALAFVIYWTALDLYYQYHTLEFKKGHAVHIYKALLKYVTIR